jgi:hypothetical protein
MAEAEAPPEKGQQQQQQQQAKEQKKGPSLQELYLQVGLINGLCNLHHCYVCLFVCLFVCHHACCPVPQHGYTDLAVVAVI